MSESVLQTLVERFPEQILTSHAHVGDETIVTRAEHLLEIARFLREDDAMAFDFMSDVTCVDYLKREPRFEVVYHLYSLKHRHRIRVKIALPEGQESLPSLCGLWAAANWGEREVWDMYGIRFEGHPNLRRVLMYEEFEGHPLRKDYPIQQSQPRMDLRRRERDAVEEYHTLYRDGADTE